MPQVEKKRVSPWLQGAMYGDLIWALAFAYILLMETLSVRFPQWMERVDLVDMVGSVITVIAMPIAAGGWLAIWGDNGPPYRFLDSIVFNVVFSICFFACLGGLSGLLYAKKWPQRFSSWKLFVIVGCAVVFAGMLPLAWEMWID